MSIDWTHLPMLIGPRFRQIQRERDNRERLARAHMRRAKGHKNHSTNKERSHKDRERQAAQSRLIASQRQAEEEYKEAVSAYWLGEREEHP